jgi:chromosome segregation ATPase
MESGSKTPLTPKERIDLIRAELESIRASTNQRKWETLKFEMEDLKDELSDEIHVGLKDAANLMGDLGKRLCNLEQKVEELTTAFSKISEASAEAATSTGNKGNR